MEQAHLFGQVTKQEWIEKVKKDLKGKNIRDLDWIIAEGLIAEPLAHNEDFEISSAPQALGDLSNDWLIGDLFDLDQKDEQINRSLLTALENGLESPEINLLRCPTLEDLTLLFKSVHLSYLKPKFSGLQNLEDWTNFLQAFVNYLKLVDQDLASTHILIEWDTSLKNTLDLARFLEKELSIKVTFICVDGKKHERVDSDVIYELAHQLFAFHTKASHLKANDLSVENLGIKICLGTSYLLEIAKIRALKLLIGNWTQVSALPLSLPFIDAITSSKSLDQEVESNKIRATIQAMAAAIAGVDRLFILPSDLQTGDSSTAFNKRYSRNVQHILKMESHLHQVSDPAAGSYYIEKLTQNLGVKAWEHFLDLRDQAS